MLRLSLDAYIVRSGLARSQSSPIPNFLTFARARRRRRGPAETFMSGLRQFLNSGIGKNLAIAVVALLVGVAGYVGYRTLGPSDAMAASTGRVFIDAETGEAFTHEISVGETIPVEAPSGQKTGYEAERCYWTKDGQIKQKPTFVLMNRFKGEEGPTFCPDCGRLVTDLNRAPMQGDNPPPTEQEYAAGRGKRPAAAASRDDR